MIEWHRGESGGGDLTAGAQHPARRGRLIDVSPAPPAWGLFLQQEERNISAKQIEDAASPSSSSVTLLEES
ncbi:hypothetical protein EYF80_004520 [Liparis tanakae]|uniref:Uncharacterized protein n=1 Tax=Liparis tanakae TaxID=230148 RepID=A0A4Z2J4R6_9TELE|nr:hypothetical protein EYF80_004520 [Liparis tanakae]